jgi:phosphocarrier protein HPr
VSERAEATLEVVNALGLHARAAAKLVRVASSFGARIELEKAGQRADAKSIMGVLLLCGERGSKITVRAAGDDATTALDALRALFEEGFGEGVA